MRRLKELVGIVLIGDGVVGLAAPRRHSLLWDFGPEWYGRVMESLADRPGLVRGLAAAEIVGGVVVGSQAVPGLARVGGERRMVGRLPARAARP
jgi:hypothetical protein